MQNNFISTGGVSPGRIRNDMNKVGFTDIAVSLALKSLSQKSMLLVGSAVDELGDEYTVYSVTSKGEQWLLDNQDELILKKVEKEEDVPF